MSRLSCGTQVCTLILVLVHVYIIYEASYLFISYSTLHEASHDETYAYININTHED